MNLIKTIFTKFLKKERKRKNKKKTYHLWKNWTQTQCLKYIRTYNFHMMLAALSAPYLLSIADATPPLTLLPNIELIEVCWVFFNSSSLRIFFCVTLAAMWYDLAKTLTSGAGKTPKTKFKSVNLVSTGREENKMEENIN